MIWEKTMIVNAGGNGIGITSNNIKQKSSKKHKDINPKHVESFTYDLKSKRFGL
jgi:hypothetical protein